MKWKKLVLFAFAVAALAAVATPPAAAGNGVPQSITFAFTGGVTCLVSPSGFGPSLNALGATSVVSVSSTGTFTFNAPNWETLSGTGTETFTNVGYQTPGNGFGMSQSAVLPFTYTVGPNGALTVTQSGPLVITYLTGPYAGDVISKTGLAPFTGQISLNGTIVLTSSTTSVETTYPGSSGSGTALDYQICHRTRTLVPILP